ncbi:hypothetical protein [Streptomyces sp. CB02959]|uniref:hypothetical protein n=1 Tax=Streptomyces sp. CB02959 TaxID=2020330 RepID=UPI000C27ED76|nr:hypothetical protein [Streptomyces sp. CB02959]
MTIATGTVMDPRARTHRQDRSVLQGAALTIQSLRIRPAGQERRRNWDAGTEERLLNCGNLYALERVTGMRGLQVLGLNVLLTRSRRMGPLRPRSAIVVLGGEHGGKALLTEPMQGQTPL